ncbi:MAG: HAD family phosphatase, partial [Oscillospiraceae bacterium]
LNIPFENRHKVIGIEDSSAGVVSIKLAGFSCVGISGGNIDQAGMSDMCDYKIDNLMQMLDIIL